MRNGKNTRRDFLVQSGLALSALALPFPLTAHTNYNQMTERNHFDIIIIGGSYSGLSAAMTLGRSLRNVLVIDSGLPCNRHTPYSHNFLTQDGKTPVEISTLAKQQVEQYDTVQFCNELATSGQKTKEGFEIGTQTGRTFASKKLIFATGIKDILPGIKGFAECWGISVIHCPYCHGYEYRNRKTGIMANGDRAFHIASQVNNLTKNSTILTSGKADFGPEQINKLKQHNIKIVEREITEIEHEKGLIKNVIFKGGSKENFDAVYAAIPFTQHSDIPHSLGCELTEQGYIKIDAFQRTTLARIFACGDNTSFMRSVANAVSSGNFIGAVVNKELTDEQF